MQGAWGTLVTVGAFLVMGVMATSMASDYLDTHAVLVGYCGGQANMATVTLERMHDLIGRLELR